MVIDLLLHVLDDIVGVGPVYIYAWNVKKQLMAGAINMQ